MTTVVRAAAIEAMFATREVSAFCAVVDASFIDVLHADEAALAHAMAPVRQAEFATGRACARAALREVHASGPVGRAGDGAPEWPAGAVGSISHSRGYCVAIAAAARGDLTIGVDVETVERIKPTIERRVLVPAERARSTALEGEARRRFVATTFAAKEAFYKAQYPRTRQYLGFDAVSVHHHHDGGIDFEPVSEAADARLVEAAKGTVLYDDGLVIVGVRIVTAGPG